MAAAGVKSLAQLSRETGLAQGVLGRVANLKESAYLSNELPSHATQTLCEYFKVLPEDLFPTEQLHGKLDKNTSTTELDYEQLTSLTGLSDMSEVKAMTHQGLDQSQYEQVDNLVSELDERQISIINHRFEMDGCEKKTYKEIGEMLGISSSRVTQIEEKALRIMRGIGHDKEIKDIWEQL